MNTKDQSAPINTVNSTRSGGLPSLPEIENGVLVTPISISSRGFGIRAVFDNTRQHFGRAKRAHAIHHREVKNSPDTCDQGILFDVEQR